MDTKGLCIVVTIGDNDGSFAVPYSEDTLEKLLEAAPLDRTSSWRGIADFTYNNRKLNFQIVREAEIKKPKEDPLGDSSNS